MRAHPSSFWQMTGIAGQKPPLYTGRAMQIPIADWILIPRIRAQSGISVSMVSIMTGDQVEALSNFSSSAAIYRGGQTGPG
jgi:hypothetical protein